MEHLTYKLMRFSVWFSQAWLQQAKSLGIKIAKLPHADFQARKKIMGIALIINITAIVIFTILWIATAKPCPNTCGDDVSKSTTHWVPCGGCRAYVWDCPNLPHPHQVGCGHCGFKYWDCPTHSDADKHGDGICTEHKTNNVNQDLQD